MPQLHQVETKIISVLAKRSSAQEVADRAGVPLGSVLSFAESLKEKGLISTESLEEKKTALSSEAKRYLSSGFPEQRVYLAAAAGKPISALSAEEKAVGMPWAMKNGWVKIEAGNLRPQKKPEEEYAPLGAIKAIEEGKGVRADVLAILEKRKLASQSTMKTIYLSPISGANQRVAPNQAAEVNLLTREMLLSGSWKGALFRKYDVSAPVEIPTPAKRHMIHALRKKITTIFIEMGFEEMEGPEVQSSFWNFDALFQPQDHPARDLADTFYLKGKGKLPQDGKLVAKVKKTHEDCWGGEWSGEVASKQVLRTHTTSLSARYLYERCQGKNPKKYFSIGKVYRNEATDYKHLAEFFQVEGIVVWEGATFRDLLGCLKEFYRKLGFEKIRFQPSFFPYTEPSLEVSVYFDKKKQWLELGGAGIFRPEVSLPLCGRYPVLAWGLSLERPLMLLNDMDDIRTFYKSNAGWLRKRRVR